MREIVVITHGIWMNAWVMRPLSRNLRSRGHDCREFSYQSINRSPLQNALRLGKFVETLDADIIHFVAHSLGGIILLHYFQKFDNAKPGRVVMLGTPLAGSNVARYVSKYKFLKNKMLGASANTLLGSIPAWNGTRPLAVFAGTRGKGIGQMLGAPLEKPNDGTVAVSETRIDNCTLHVEVPYSHTGMLLSKAVAASVDEFLRTGNVT